MTKLHPPNRFNPTPAGSDALRKLRPELQLLSSKESKAEADECHGCQGEWPFHHGRFGIWGFLKWWYPTTMGFPTKNDHFGVFWGYHHFRKHPYKNGVCFFAWKRGHTGHTLFELKGIFRRYVVWKNMCAAVFFCNYIYIMYVFLYVYVYKCIYHSFFRYINMWIYLFMPEEFSLFRVFPLLAHYCFDRQYIAKQRRMVERLRYWCRICLLAEEWVLNHPFLTFQGNLPVDHVHLPPTMVQWNKSLEWGKETTQSIGHFTCPINMGES